jgi:hypothetical protein
LKSMKRLYEKKTLIPEYQKIPSSSRGETHYLN